MSQSCITVHWFRTRVSRPHLHSVYPPFQTSETPLSRFSFSFRSDSDGATKAEAQAAHKARVSRVRLATLASDMRCFLLSNPGAVFADFMRWYSPPNWRTYGGGYGGGDVPFGAGVGDRVGDRVAEGNSIGRARSGVEDARTAVDDSDGFDANAASSPSPSSSAHRVGSSTSLEGVGGAPPGWRVFVPKRRSRSCKLVWERKGEIVWRSASHGDEGIDRQEGAEWMEAWLEVESALAAAGDSRGMGGKGPEKCRPPRPLFSPSQVLIGVCVGSATRGKEVFTHIFCLKGRWLEV